MTARRKTKPELSIVRDEPLDYAPSPVKRFTTKHLKSFSAKSEKQKEFLRMYFQDRPVLLAQIGSAGTGKTLMAFYAALSEVLDPATPYEHIIVVRSAVQAREIGFLKGTEEEKNAVYEKAYSGICDTLMTFRSNNYRHLKESGIIQFENTSFLRGLTFDNCIIIVDEVQDLGYPEIRTICGRIGVDSRIILCGDFKQCDLHKKGDQSGLAQFLRVVDHMPGEYAAIIEYGLEDIVRSGFVREFLIADEACSKT